MPDTLSVNTWNETLLANLEITLPNTLERFNVDASQISTLAPEGLPLLMEAIDALQSGLSLPDTDIVLARRGFFPKIGRWPKKLHEVIAKVGVKVLDVPSSPHRLYQASNSVRQRSRF